MNDMVVAICDDEKDYACHLMEYLRGRGIPYEEALFTSAERLLGMTSPDQVILLVIAESEYTPEVKSRGYPEVLVLNESGHYLSEKDAGTISKYQSMDRIAEQILARCAMRKDVMPKGVRHGMAMRTVGFFTPVGRSLQTTFALTLGQLMAKGSKVLYLNMEPFPGWDLLMHREFSGSLSGLLYFTDCAKEKVASHLPLLVTQIGDLDVIPPMNSCSDLKNTKKEQWFSMLDVLGDVTEYEYVLLDLSFAVDGLWDLLRRCDEIYMMVQDDPVSKAKIDSYEKTLKREGFEDLGAKTRRWNLPRFEGLPENPEEYARGPLADYIRSALSKKRNLDAGI